MLNFTCVTISTTTGSVNPIAPHNLFYGTQSC
jgi:hypothetical protein